MNAFADATPDPSVDASLTPSPHLCEVLRRPIESTLHAAVRLMNKPLTVLAQTFGVGLLECVERQVAPERVRMKMNRPHSSSPRTTPISGGPDTT